MSAAIRMCFGCGQTIPQPSNVRWLKGLPFCEACQTRDGGVHDPRIERDRAQQKYKQYHDLWFKIGGAEDEQGVPKVEEMIVGLNTRRLLAEAECDRLQRDLDMLTDRNEPEPGALHYDGCPYKPFADLLSWDEPENPPECTCSTRHKAAYWKARSMLSKGMHELAANERDRLREQVWHLRQVCASLLKDLESYDSGGAVWSIGARISRLRDALACTES